MKKNIKNISDDLFDLDFLSDKKDDEQENEIIKKEITGFYKVVVADDDEDVHTITKLLFKDFSFEGKGLKLLHTYSGKETMELLEKNLDTAVLLLDVVMEDDSAGFRVVQYLRDDLENKNTRIILRTGQPGQAPEDKVIRDYDINDYKLKTELTKQKLFTTMYSCLRSYRDIRLIEKNKNALERVVQISGNLFKQNSLEEFLMAILEQLALFYKEYSDTMYIRENNQINPEGFIYRKEQSIHIIVAATGKYKNYIDNDIRDIEDLNNIYTIMEHIHPENNNIISLENGFIFFNKGANGIRNYVFVDADKKIYDYGLIQLFLNNYSLALDNFHLNQLLLRNQDAIIFTLSETIERHSNETSNHVRRVALMMYLLAQKHGLPRATCEMIRIASAMHDIGKIGIPDQILKKPARLTEEEFEVIKRHSKIGYDILSDSDFETFKTAAQIAYYHHEKYDGTGYPHGMKGEEIPLYGRMMAIIDVFDALANKRCYKDAWPIEKVIDYIKTQKSSHFDPYLVDLFLENMDEVKKILETYKN